MRVILFLSLCIVSFGSYALDLDRETIHVSYLGLPTHPIVNSSDRNYSVYYNSPYKSNEFQRSIEDYFHIDGFTRLDSNAGIHLDFQFEDLKVTATEVISDERQVKDAKGKSYIEYYYIPVLSYDTSARVIVSYANGESNIHKFGSRNNKFEGPESYSTSEANIALTSNLYQIVYEMQNQFIVETAMNLKTLLNELHGYKAIDTTDYLLVLDSRNYPEYKDYKRYYQLTTRLFKQMTPFDSIDGIKTEIQPVLEFLKAIPEKYPSRKKAHIKMRYASYYNMAKIYYYLDELEKSIDYYEKVIENDYHEGQSKRNIKGIDKLKDLLAVNQVNTRHFNIQLQPESPQNDMPSQSQGSGYNYFDAEIQTIDNNSIEGKIELSHDVQDVVYELQNITVLNFKYLNNADEIDVKKIYTSTIDSIQLSDLKLQKINFTSQQQNSNEQVNTGQVEAGVLVSALAVELFHSSSIALYDFNGELILKKANEMTGTSTSSTAFSFAFKKKLGQYFSDCNNIQAEIKSGQYRNNTEGLINVVKAYSQCNHAN